MRGQRNKVQMKEQDKIARDLSTTELSHMPDREFKVMAIKILAGLGKRAEDPRKMPTLAQEHLPYRDSRSKERKEGRKFV